MPSNVLQDRQAILDRFRLNLHCNCVYAEDVDQQWSTHRWLQDLYKGMLINLSQASKTGKIALSLRNHSIPFTLPRDQLIHDFRRFLKKGYVNIAKRIWKHNVKVRNFYTDALANEQDDYTKYSIIQRLCEDYELAWKFKINPIFETIWYSNPKFAEIYEASDKNVKTIVARLKALKKALLTPQLPKVHETSTFRNERSSDALFFDYYKSKPINAVETVETDCKEDEDPYYYPELSRGF